MEDMKVNVHKICRLKETLLEWAAAEAAKGVQCVNAHEMGAVTDMIKDLAEAEEKCYKACYYKKMVEELDEMGEENERMGYDSWRYSSGRFAPTGKGHRSGYIDMGDMDEMHEPESHRGWDAPRTTNNRMGYSGSDRGDRYERYTKARMGYHESKDAAHKEHMDTAARDYVVDIAESVKEMWKDADPAMRKEIKNKFVALTSELN